MLTPTQPAVSSFATTANDGEADAAAVVMVTALMTGMAVLEINRTDSNQTPSSSAAAGDDGKQDE
jgi:hypothetical protein